MFECNSPRKVSVKQDLVRFATYISPIPAHRLDPLAILFVLLIDSLVNTSSFVSHRCSNLTALRQRSSDPIQTDRNTQSLRNRECTSCPSVSVSLRSTAFDYLYSDCQSECAVWIWCAWNHNVIAQIRNPFGQCDKTAIESENETKTDEWFGRDFEFGRANTIDKSRGNQRQVRRLSDKEPFVVGCCWRWVQQLSACNKTQVGCSIDSIPSKLFLTMCYHVVLRSYVSVNAFLSDTWSHSFNLDRNTNGSVLSVSLVSIEFGENFTVNYLFSCFICLPCVCLAGQSESMNTPRSKCLSQMLTNAIIKTPLKRKSQQRRQRPYSKRI